jgi:hypothetical protein
MTARVKNPIRAYLALVSIRRASDPDPSRPASAPHLPNIGTDVAQYRAPQSLNVPDARSRVLI